MPAPRIRTRRIALVLIVAATIAAPVKAQPADDLTAFASLETSITLHFDVAKAALADLAKDATDLAARSRLAQSSIAALELLDGADVRDCYRDWHAVSRTAFWLLARSMELIDAYDAAMLSVDLAARDAAQAEIGQTIPPGVGLLYYVTAVRQRVSCVETVASTGAPGSRLATSGGHVALHAE